MKNHDTLRTRTGTELVSLNTVSQGCAHMAHSGVMLKLNTATYQCNSVFLKTLALWKLADVITIPESLDNNDNLCHSSDLSGEPADLASCQEHVLTKIIDLLTDPNSTENTIFGIFG